MYPSASFAMVFTAPFDNPSRRDMECTFVLNSANKGREIRKKSTGRMHFLSILKIDQRPSKSRNKMAKNAGHKCPWIYFKTPF
jgi:hypothetical protein